MSLVVGWCALALLHFLWQGGAIALGFALVRRWLSQPGQRYVAGLIALLLMLMAPVATVTWTMGAESRVIDPASLIGSASAASTPFSARSEPQPMLAAADRSGASAEPFRLLLVIAWLLGVLVLSAVNAIGWFRLRRLRRSASVVPSWAQPMAELCQRIGVRQPVALLKSQEIDVPMVVGWIKPVVLLPASVVTGMSPAMVEALVLHELAHVRRHDYLVNLLQVAAETLLFYHPAVWWVSRTVRAEREHLCDDVASALCCKRSDYMQALAHLERRRSTPTITPTVAVAAAGGSLMSRIRRLTGRPTSTSSSGWALSIAGLLLVLGAAAIQVGPAVAGQNPAGQAMEGQPREGRTIQGEWRSETDSSTDGVQLDLRVGSRHRHGSWIERDELQRTATGYRLVRDAGTIELTGELDRNWSRFEFRPNPDYASQMDRIGFDIDTSPRKLFEMASLDVSLEFARGIAVAGYDGIETSRLVEFRIHGVSGEFIQRISSAGYDDLPPSRLVEFRIHGVSPEFVQGMADSGFSDLTPARLIEFRIHGVSPEFVARMAASGIEGMGASRLVEFRIHGVTADFVDALARSGIEGLRPSRLVEFRIHGVSPQFVEEMAALVPDLTPGRLIEMRIHGVTPQFARRAQAEHDDGLSASDLVSLRIHGRNF